MAEGAKSGPRGDIEIDCFPGPVGMSVRQHDLDQRLDIGDSRGGPGLAGRGEEPESVHVSRESRHFLVCQVKVIHVELACFAQYVVVDVGHVADEPGLVTQVAEAALQYVVRDIGGGVAQMGGVVRRHAAGVHGYRSPRAGGRLERSYLLPGRVIEAHHDGLNRCP